MEKPLVWASRCDGIGQICLSAKYTGKKDQGVAKVFKDWLLRRLNHNASYWRNHWMIVYDTSWAQVSEHLQPAYTVGSPAWLSGRLCGSWLALALRSAERAVAQQLRLNWELRLPTSFLKGRIFDLWFSECFFHIVFLWEKGRPSLMLIHAKVSYKSVAECRTVAIGIVPLCRVVTPCISLGITTVHSGTISIATVLHSSATEVSIYR